MTTADPGRSTPRPNAAVPRHRHRATARVRWRRTLAIVVCGGLLAAWPTPPRAWDAEAMLRAAQVQGPRALAGARALQALLTELIGSTEAVRLAEVNDFFNRNIAFATDLEVWGVDDYWASPLEALGKGRGDCEDYVIAKYFALLAAGVPVAKLRLVYVRATLGPPPGRVEPHMVLAYHAAPGAEPLVLDNLEGAIRPASRRRDLEPVFSFNTDGLWQGVGAQTLSDPAERLSPWREVVAKARAEGFR